MAKIYIDNSRYMEFIDDIATQMTEIAYIDGTDGSCVAYKEIDDGLSNEKCIVYTEDAQDYYNDRYDEVETMLNKTLNIHSNEHFDTDN
tara:strand:+ start:403 stop:669 length:267 start_codon:yes stop_codon:yes gene_type:complete